MTKQETLIRMRMELAALYPGQEDMVRLVEDAELSLIGIPFADKAINSWRNILVEADRQNCIPRLIDVVRLEYPARRALNEAFDAYQQVTGTGAGPAADQPAAEPRPIVSQIDSRVEATFLIRMPHILTGLVGYWSRDNNPLVQWQVSSLTGEKRRLLLISFVEGYTARAIDTVELEGTEVREVCQLPTFFPEQLSAITFPVRASLNLRVETVQGSPELHRTEPVWLHPRSTFLLATKDPTTGEWQDWLPWLGAYVTPNDPTVMRFLRQVATHHPSGQLVGYQGTPEDVQSQVRAIFEALKTDGGITYVNSMRSTIPSPDVVTQRVRLPGESLEERQANDADATLLYASLIEAISLDPALVLVPGHALVGWATWNSGGEWDYLETTMTASYPFDEAVDTGRRLAERFQRLSEETGNASLFRRLPLSELRARGILPLG